MVVITGNQYYQTHLLYAGALCHQQFIATSAFIWSKSDPPILLDLSIFFGYSNGIVIFKNFRLTLYLGVRIKNLKFRFSRTNGLTQYYPRLCQSGDKNSP